MLHTPLAQISTLLAVATSAWAVGAGRWPERLVGAAFGCGWIVSIVFQDHRLHHHVQAASFGVDGTLLALTLAVVAVSRRTWVIWAAAFNLLMVLTHVAMLADLRFGQWTYITASDIWSGGFILALGLGVALEGARPAALPTGFRAPAPSTPSAMARRRS